MEQLLLQLIEENKQLKDAVNALHQKFDTFVQNQTQTQTQTQTQPRKNKKVPSVIEQRESCSGTTAKGTRCKNMCEHDGKCRMHANQTVDQTVVRQKPKKQKKVKIQLPRHTHAPGEEPAVYCQLCQTHGDILDPELPEREFEIVQTQIQMTEQEEEDEVEDEDPFIGKLSLLLQNNRTQTQASSNWADDEEDDFFGQ